MVIVIDTHQCMFHCNESMRAVVTGNAVECFGKYIIDKTGKKTVLKFLIITLRDILAKRFNSLLCLRIMILR